MAGSRQRLETMVERMQWQQMGGRLGEIALADIPTFGFTQTREVIIELCRAGGIGVWGATRDTSQQIKEGLARIAREVGGCPFGVDLVLPSDMSESDGRPVIEAAIPAGYGDFVANLRSKYDVPGDGLPGTRSRFVRSDVVSHTGAIQGGATA